MKYTPKKFLEDVRSDVTAFGYPAFKVSKPSYAETWTGKVACMVVEVDTGERFEFLCRALSPKTAPSADEVGK